MPELPDVTVYVECIEAKLLGRTLERIRIASPFVVRSVDPPIREIEGKAVRGVRRIGKRIAIGFDEDLWVVIHLMIAGRFRWLKPGAKIPGRLGLAAFDFDNGTLVLTEAGTQRRASIMLMRASLPSSSLPVFCPKRSSASITRHARCSPNGRIVFAGKPAVSFLFVPSCLRVWNSGLAKLIQHRREGALQGLAAVTGDYGACDVLRGR